MKHQTLAHFSYFRHFSHFRQFRHFSYFSSLFTNVRSTTVENPLQISPFYAKQSQSQVGQKQRKLFCDKYIRVLGQLVIQTNKAKTNPIQTQFKPKQTQFKPNKAKNKANLTKSQKMNPFTRIRTFMMKYCVLLAEFNTLKGANFEKSNTILYGTIYVKFGSRCQNLIIKLNYFVPANMEKQKRAYIYAACAILLWSTIASAFKMSLPYYTDILDLHILHLLFYASLIATITLFLHLLFSKKLILLKSFSKIDYLYSALMGFLSPFLYYLVLLNAYSILSAQEAMTINWLWPMTLVLLSIPLLKQKIKTRGMIAITISFFGVFIIATRGNLLGFKFTNPTGVLLALGSTIIWSLFWIYNTKDKQDEAVRLFLNFIFGTVFIFISILFFVKIKMPDFKGMLGATYIGLFELGITFLLWLKALKLSKTTAHVVNLVYLAPFLSLVAISLVVGEKILLSTIIGLIFIVGGIILQKL